MTPGGPEPDRAPATQLALHATSQDPDGPHGPEPCRRRARASPTVPAGARANSPAAQGGVRTTPVVPACHRESALSLLSARPRLAGSVTQVPQLLVRVQATCGAVSAVALSFHLVHVNMD